MLETVCSDLAVLLSPGQRVKKKGEIRTNINGFIFNDERRVGLDCNVDRGGNKRQRQERRGHSQLHVVSGYVCVKCACEKGISACECFCGKKAGVGKEEQRRGEEWSREEAKKEGGREEGREREEFLSSWR